MFGLLFVSLWIWGCSYLIENVYGFEMLIVFVLCILCLSDNIVIIYSLILIY